MLDAALATFAIAAPALCIPGAMLGARYARRHPPLCETCEGRHDPAGACLPWH